MSTNGNINIELFLLVFLGAILGLPLASGEDLEEEENFEVVKFTVYLETPEMLEKAVADACRDAREDFAKGTVDFIYCGLPTENTKNYVNFLKEKYSIRPSWKGCVTTSIDEAYAAIYNEMILLLFLVEKDIDIEIEFLDFCDDQKAEPVAGGDATR